MAISATVLEAGSVLEQVHEVSSVSTDLMAVTNLSEIYDDWCELLETAVEPNPNFSPDFASYLLSADGGQVLTFRDNHSGGHRKLIGLLPLSSRFSSLPSVFSISCALHSPYSACSVPLIRQGYEPQVCEAFLDWLSGGRGKLGLVVFQEFRLDGPVWRHLRAALEARGQEWQIGEEEFRPLVDTRQANSFDEYLSGLKGKTRQSLKRKARQLEALGEVTYEVHSGANLKPAMQEFMDLEAAGWTREFGTAMGQVEFTRKLALDVLAGENSSGIRLESLRLDGRAIAMTIHVGNGDSAIHFKPAYDEEYSRYSPGLLLHLKSIEGLYQDKWATSLDAATKPDSPLGRIWRQKRHVGQLYIAASPATPSWVLTAAVQAVSAYRSARASAGRLIKRIK